MQEWDQVWDRDIFIDGMASHVGGGVDTAQGLWNGAAGERLHTGHVDAGLGVFFCRSRNALYTRSVPDPFYRKVHFTEMLLIQKVHRRSTPPDESSRYSWRLGPN